MLYAKWNNKKYKLIKDININQSSREVTYSNSTVDFENKKIEDLPYAQQEVNILDENNIIKFTGFVSDYNLPNLKKYDKDRELSLSLFSPRQMATKRTVTIIRTDKLSTILNQILIPLYQDGFTLKELNVKDKIITIKLISKTVEEILDYLSKKYSLYWNIRHK